MCDKYRKYMHFCIAVFFYKQNITGKISIGAKWTWEKYEKYK